MSRPVCKPTTTDSTIQTDQQTPMEDIPKTLEVTISRTQTSYPGCSTFVRQAFLRKGIPEDTIPILIASITSKTLNLYDTVFKRWWSYCMDKNIDPFAYKLPNIFSFIKSIVDKDYSYSSINIHRAALALVIDIPESHKNIFKKFYKGIYNLKPSMPRYQFTWDPQPVLTYLETLFPLTSLSLQKLTYKLAMLIALTSAHRLQTLSLIKIQNINIKRDRIEIRIPDRIKTSARNKNQPTLVFPYFKDRPQLCVASTLCHYLKISKDLHPESEERLFLTVKKPYKATSTQTLSRWLKDVLKLSNIDTSVFTGYSVRHAATSAGARAGLNIEIIRETAGWTENSQIFSQFYNRPLAKDYGVFAKTILSTKKHRYID